MPLFADHVQDCEKMVPVIEKCASIYLIAYTYVR